MAIEILDAEQIDFEPRGGFLLSLSPGQGRCRLHTHRGFAEFVYGVEGACFHTINGVAQSHAEGRLIFIRARDRHELVMEGGVLANLAFPETWLDRIGELWNLSDLRALLDGLPEPATVEVPAEARPRLKALFEDLLIPRSDPLARARFTQVLAVLFTDYLPLPQAGGEKGATLPEWLRLALERLDREVRLDLTAADLALWCCHCPAHVSRVFRRHLGMSPTDYLNRRRLRQAAELLAGGRTSVLSIGERCGFSTPSYFHRQFKALYGESPYRYRCRHAVLPWREPGA